MSPKPNTVTPIKSNPNPKAAETVEPTKPTEVVEAPKAAVSQETEPPTSGVSATSTTAATTDATDAHPSVPKGKKPLTILIDDKLWKQLRLLSSVEGKTLSAIFLEAVSRDVPGRLRAALAAIQADTE
jgi:hypothetical protein